jgi:nitric oxide reductase activation protein
MISSVILHEVLKKQGIEHAIVEHRGHFDEPEIDVNILVDFNSKEEEKLNIMQLAAGGGNRDGLSLYWAEKYINQKTFCDNKLIIVLSDGMPAHAYDEYYGAVANKDTANAAKKIINRGTNIIAVALDNECVDDDDSTYGDLKEIYPPPRPVQRLEASYRADSRHRVEAAVLRRDESFFLRGDCVSRTKTDSAFPTRPEREISCKR